MLAICQLLVCASVITNLIEVRNHAAVERSFDVTAPFISRLYHDQSLLLLGNENGVAQFNDGTTNRASSYRPGDILRVRGVFRKTNELSIQADCREIRFLSHGPAPRPVPISAQDFLNGTCDCRLSEITGTVKDIFPDELDPMFTFLVLLSGDETIYAPIRSSQTSSRQEFPPVGSEITLVGVPTRTSPRNRRHLGRYFLVHDPSSIRILKPAPTDPFRAPDIKDILTLRPQDISQLGRHRASGRVLCTIRDGSFLLRSDPDLIVRIETNGSDLPSPGKAVEAIGYPESNLYHIDLVRSIWRPTAQATDTNEAPTDACPDVPLPGLNTRQFFTSAYHGRLIRLSGTALNVPDASSSEDLLRLEHGKQIISVDVSSLKGILETVAKGCTVEVTGICVLDFETWRPNAAFPRITGFTLVPRSDADIRIVARPPWWTPQRLFILLCILLPIILASVILNFILRRLVERRSRALLREQSAKLTETLRVDERTRLAAELHDSVAQDLTGISMQIETAEDLAADAPEKLRRILGTASRSLLNCREELRNCLWDLRNRALDERNMGDAIMRTLKPHLEGVELTLRFNVPRNDVSDATAHATLQIIRELATNAIRHGHAKHLRVCGTIDTKRLTFSFSDDGCGFDPDTVPGATQGHFGLTGIRERIRKLGGTIAIQSSAETGTKFTITL